MRAVALQAGLSSAHGRGKCRTLTTRRRPGTAGSSHTAPGSPGTRTGQQMETRLLKQADLCVLFPCEYRQLLVIQLFRGFFFHKL